MPWHIQQMYSRTSFFESAIQVGSIIPNSSPSFCFWSSIDIAIPFLNKFVFRNDKLEVAVARSCTQLHAAVELLNIFLGGCRKISRKSSGFTILFENFLH